MAEEIPEKALEIMRERFGSDSLIAVATIEGDRPSVRTVNSYYENGAFYVITHALSGKMKQIASNPNAAICGDWFTAHGIGENIGRCFPHGIQTGISTKAIRTPAFCASV